VPRAVLDTNILISAFITPRGTPAKVLQAWRAGRFDLVTSPPLLLELREALSRPHLKDRYRLSPTDIRDFLTLLTSAAFLVTAPPLGTHDGRSETDTAGATGPSASKLSRAILSMAFSRWFCTIQTPVSTSFT
jgi:putative PIN family toxin of toxin-antitoxin system